MAAVMHAGFHSAALYHALRGAVRPLVELLGDDEDKTRANAAGALGNLVRNSPMLCPTLLQAHALEVPSQPILLFSSHHKKPGLAFCGDSKLSALIELQKSVTGSFQELSWSKAGEVRRAQALMAMINEPGRERRSSSGELGEPAKIALFSLGNMAAHRECAEVLLRLGIDRTLQRLSASSDPMTLKYVQRIHTKLQSVQQIFHM